MMSGVSMTASQKKILNIIQTEFPISSDPYAELGNSVGCSREEAYEAVIELRKTGVIRRIGGVFSSEKLGYTGCLAAAKVDPSMLSEAASIAGAHVEVTHNYERDCEYNLWFTIVAATPEKRDEILDDVRSCDGVQSVHALPSKQTFKIKVDFNFSGDKNGA